MYCPIRTFSSASIKDSVEKRYCYYLNNECAKLYKIETLCKLYYCPMSITYKIQIESL